MRAKKNALIPQFWDESMSLRGATQIQEARRLSFEASCYGEGAVGVSAPARPLSFLRACRNALNQWRSSLYGGVTGLLLRLHSGKSYGDIVCKLPQKVKNHGRFITKSYAMGRGRGLTSRRQSRSPRARPSTSISAVAMLLAKGMLFWSHRRER